MSTRSTRWCLGPLHCFDELADGHVYLAWERAASYDYVFCFRLPFLRRR